MVKLILSFLLIVGPCHALPKGSFSKENEMSKQKVHRTHTERQKTDSITVYQTDDLIIKQLSDGIYQHISFLDTEDYGKVTCNGMLVINKNEGVIFDTPTDNQGSLELIQFTREVLRTSLIGIGPTHFHEDCIGGIQEFISKSIPIYGSKRTIDLLTNDNNKLTGYITGFEDSLTLEIGTKKVYAEYFGEGHTKDNIIGVFPGNNVVFGGCLLKALGSSKGFLGDANTEKWSKTVRKIKLKYPNTSIVIPGHGNPGGPELFDYTIQLFKLK